MKKIFITVVGFLFAMHLNAQENDIYTKFFPDPEKQLPVPITTGSDYYTSYTNVLKFLDNLALKYPEVMTIATIGKSQRGNNVPLVTLNKKGKISDSQKIRVTFLGSMHGDEPISTDAMLNTIYEILENPSYSAYLDKAIVQIIPIVNVDGHKDETRFSNDETDLNRNLGILNVPETVNVKNAINTFDPHVVIDFHEYNPQRKDFLDIDDCLTSSYDAMFLYSGNLNVDENIRKMIENDFVTPTKSLLEKNKRVIRNYCSSQRMDNQVILNIGGITSRSSATNYALQNRISILMEIRGVTEKEKAVKRRIETSTLAALSYLDIANKESDNIKSTIEKANQKAIEGKNEIVITSKPTMIESNFQFVNTCTNEYSIYKFKAKDNTQHVATATRKRPEGYVIITKSKPLFNVLRTSGIDFSVTEKAYDMEVETYVQKEEGKFEINKEIMQVPARSILIKAHQKMGNTIIDLLEPEGVNSLYQNKILKTLPNSDRLRLLRVNLSQIVQLQN
ncbi:M14 family zinc carboxypeptidase [Flavobacterium sp. TSSA_36]|uniref:M14 family zinc carboxypeptidase n=1 Tax=Flavobacterium sp. TSSA_36 TaxID=3447669 RepID=UPI003F2B1977